MELLFPVFKGTREKEKMKSPCVKECPDRSMRCRESCEKFQEYEAYKRTQYEARRKQFMFADYTFRAVAQVKKQRRIK